MSAPAGEPDWPADGLLPAVIQDGSDQRVLMLGWMDTVAYRATLDTGDVHFHSRSRDRLWRKGETSGNVLRLRELSLDCDRDAILVEVVPVGPTCHRGTRSCFDPDGASADRAAPAFGWLNELWATIESRALHRPAGSYTASLLARGVDATSRKVSEEATEVVLAAKDDAAAEAAGADRAATRVALAGEVADLLFHAFVLLAERGVPPAGVLDILRDRHARTGDTVAGGR